MIESAQRAVGDFEYTHRLLLPGGAIRHLHLVAHATRDGEGRLEYVGAVRDVTQWRASQEALAKASAELVNAARLSRMGVAMSAVAHEINQPLSGIVINASTCLRMLSSEPPNVDGAREAARRAFRDASEAMSTIESRPRELLITTEWNRHDCVRLSVRDAGIGFLPETAGVLFEAFYTTKRDGMGLGLCISRTIVEAHRWRLWATANEGPGATFAFSLPCEPYAHAAAG